MAIGSIGALWLYTRPTGPFKTLTGIFGFIRSFLMVSLAAMLGGGLGRLSGGEESRARQGVDLNSTYRELPAE